MEIDSQHSSLGMELRLDRVLANVGNTGSPLSSEMVAFVSSFNAAEVNATLEDIVDKKLDENRIIDVIDWIVSQGENGLSPYKRSYLVWRLVPKFLLPSILEKRAVSYRMLQCLKVLCAKHDYVVWDPLVKGLTTAMLDRRDESDGLLQLAKMLTTNYIAPRSSESLVMLSCLLDAFDESKEHLVIYQLLESLFEPMAEGDGEPHDVDQFTLEQLLKNMLAASEEIKESTTYGNVLHDFTKVYGRRCLGLEVLRNLLQRCIQLYPGVLKDSLEALLGVLKR